MTRGRPIVGVAAARFFGDFFSPPLETRDLVAGFAAVPGVVAGYFVSRGALAPFLYDTVSHNVVPRLGRWQQPWDRLACAQALPLLLWAAQRLVRHAPDARLGGRRALVLLTAGVYEITLEGVWPLVTRQDLLPLAPMIVMCAAWMLSTLPAAALRLAPFRAWLARGAWLAPAVAAGLLAVGSMASTPVETDATRAQMAFLSELLRLTGSADRVIDIKGESIYRARPTPLVFEAITLERLHQSLLRDDTPERVVAGRTPVAVPDNDQFPARTRAFLDVNYIPVGRPRVVGSWLNRRVSEHGSLPFDIRVPQRYAVIGERGSARGWLDDRRYDGPRELSAGPHRYRPVTGEGRLAVLWAQALERGFTPFEKGRSVR